MAVARALRKIREAWGKEREKDRWMESALFDLTRGTGEALVTRRLDFLVQNQSNPPCSAAAVVRDFGSSWRSQAGRTV